MPSRRDAGWLAALVIVGAGLAMRPPISGLAAALADATAVNGIPGFVITAVTVLPVLMFAVAAPPARALATRFGSETVLTGCLILIAASMWWRGDSAVGLVIGTGLAGMGIAGIGVVVPEMIKRHFASAPAVWTAVYTTAIGLGAALGAFLTVLAGDALGNMWAGLALWAVPAAVAAVLAVALALRVRSAPLVTLAATTVRASRRITVLVTAFFALQATAYFAVTFWLASYLSDIGFPLADAAAMLSWFSLAGLPATLIVPLLAARVDTGILAVAIASLGVVALIGVSVDAHGMAMLWVAVLGVSQSSAFGLATALIVLRAPNAQAAARLAAQAQSVGYGVAAAGPLVFSVLHVATNGWLVPFAFVGAVTVAQGAVGIALRVPRRPPRATV